MTELHQVLAERVTGWRTAGYPHDRFPAIAEILLHARMEDGSPRYLREPQIRALESYWYLRLVEGTPHIADLYERCFPQVSDRLAALGLDQPASGTSPGHRPINKLESIELRSDPKYGHFFEHRPASARVRLDGSRVVIDDFISPSILERLGQQEGVLAP